MRIAAIIPVVALALAVARPLLAEQPATMPAALSPAVQSALNDLTSDDFAARQRALSELEQALGRQSEALIAPSDPESRARVQALLEFNEGLTRWLSETLKLPEPMRQRLISFGLRPDMLPIVAKLSATLPGARIAGLHELAKIQDPLASDLLAPLLEDPDRSVYIAAMELAWDRPPSDSIVDKLWERSVDAGFAVYSPTPVPQPEIRFRGELLGPTFFDNAAYRHMQDSNIACEVLIHLHAPQVEQRLVELFNKIDDVVDNPGGRDHRAWMYGANSAPMKNVYMLLKAYRPKGVMPALYHLATGPMRQPFNGQVNNVHYFWSNRTQPLAMLVELTDQRPESYKLTQLTRPNGIWAFPTQADEETAIKKLQAWWEENSAQPAGGPPGEATTQPRK